jgi:hypothetical protein
MRKNRNCPEKPSTRQGINISKLLINSYLKKGFLQFQDFIETSVVTSKIECQKIAEETALDILLKNENKDIPEKQEVENDLLTIISKINDNLTYVTPHGQGLENEYTPYYETETVVVPKENMPSIGVGPGEDEVIKIFLSGVKEGNKELQKISLDYLMKILIKIGNEFERKIDWSKTSAIRPYQPGEDPELIDEEKSLENIMDLSRRPDEIRYNDFLMKKKRKNDRIICYVMDISNTMFYEFDGLNSLNYSILCLIPLIWAFRREKFSVILYESNTHIIKDLQDNSSIENITEEILSMLISSTKDIEKKFMGNHGSMTWGGTVPNSSIKYAYEMLTEFGNKSEKIFFMYSDFVLTEPGKSSNDFIENNNYLQKMIQEEIKVIGCVSPLAYKPIFKPYTLDILRKLEEIGVKIAETSKPSEFLNDVQYIIEKTRF